ncbi:hypothetical protein [Sphingomonas sp. Leaf231]|uniref:hypothetical protein n=1 Tax=Sphingomonas sp. Leaf231 TaxID=1736301 RepID=UPI001F406C99|nr:hypothetical protein [Sphingomonas sp. Leaf231]
MTTPSAAGVAEVGAEVGAEEEVVVEPGARQGPAARKGRYPALPTTRRTSTPPVSPCTGPEMPRPAARPPQVVVAHSTAAPERPEAR